MRASKRASQDFTFRKKCDTFDIQHSMSKWSRCNRKKASRYICLYKKAETNDTHCVVCPFEMFFDNLAPFCDLDGIWFRASTQNIRRKKEEDEELNGIVNQCRSAFARVCVCACLQKSQCVKNDVKWLRNDCNFVIRKFEMIEMNYLFTTGFGFGWLDSTKVMD